ncbi:MAG: hypothetical protein WCO14_03630, partial [bacterium]
MARRHFASSRGESEDAPEVILALEEEVATFRNQRWDYRVSTLEIFDTTFINGNVYTGDLVEHENKRGLYGFVLGEEGVRLAQAADRLDGELRETRKQKRHLEECLRLASPGHLEPEQFVMLTPDPACYERIVRKEKEIASLQQENLRQHALTSQPLLQCLIIPAMPLRELRSLLSRLNEGARPAPIQRTLEEIQGRLGPQGANWIRYGLDHEPSGKCPFCRTPVQANPHVQAYREALLPEWSSLERELETLGQRFSAILTEKVLLDLQRILAGNRGQLAFWGEHISFEVPSFPHAELEETWICLRQALQQELALDLLPQAVSLQPSPERGLSPELEGSIRSYLGLQAVAAAYNEQVEAINAEIQAFQQTLARGSIEVLRKELSELRELEARGKPITDQYCQEYQKLLRQEETVKQQQDLSQRYLVGFNKRWFAQFQEKVNAVLSSFQADFRLISVKTSFLGGKHSCDYALELHGAHVIQLGSEKTSVARPCFRQTLSDGDKNTLALAIFLAKTQQDPLLRVKTVVFDDPVPTLGAKRRQAAEQFFAHIFQNAGQTIVFSHDQSFLEALWHTSGKQASLLKIERNQGGSE